MGGTISNDMNTITWSNGCSWTRKQAEAANNAAPAEPAKTATKRKTPVVADDDSSDDAWGDWTAESGISKPTPAAQGEPPEKRPRQADPLEQAPTEPSRS